MALDIPESLENGKKRPRSPIFSKNDSSLQIILRQSFDNFDGVMVGKHNGKLRT